MHTDAKLTHHHVFFVYDRPIRRTSFNYALPLTAGSVLALAALAEVVQHPGGWLCIVAGGLGIISGLVIKACPKGGKR